MLCWYHLLMHRRVCRDTPRWRLGEILVTFLYCSLSHSLQTGSLFIFFFYCFYCIYYMYIVCFDHLPILSPPTSPLCPRQDLLLDLEFTVFLVLLARRPSHHPVSLSLPTLLLGSVQPASCFTWMRGLSSGPHACAVRVLLTSHCLSPSTGIFNFHKIVSLVLFVVVPILLFHSRNHCLVQCHEAFALLSSKRPFFLHFPLACLF